MGGMVYGGTGHGAVGVDGSTATWSGTGAVRGGTGRYGGVGGGLGQRRHVRGGTGRYGVVRGRYGGGTGAVRGRYRGGVDAVLHMGRNGRYMAVRGRHAGGTGAMGGAGRAVRWEGRCGAVRVREGSTGQMERKGGGTPVRGAVARGGWGRK